LQIFFVLETHLFTKGNLAVNVFSLRTLVELFLLFYEIASANTVHAVPFYFYNNKLNLFSCKKLNSSFHGPSSSSRTQMIEINGGCWAACPIMSPWPDGIQMVSGSCQNFAANFLHFSRRCNDTVDEEGHIVRGGNTVLHC